MSKKNKYLIGFLNYLKLLSIPVLALCIFHFILDPLLGSDSKTGNDTEIEKIENGIEKEPDKRQSISYYLNIPGAEFDERRGFFSGIWHSGIIVFTFIFSLFSDTKIYSGYNTGFGYQMGFALGIGFTVYGIFRSLYFSSN